MPTYEYECKKCGHNFEVFQAMSDEPIKKCTKCDGEVRRLIFGGAGVIFKGSGFYVTDKAAKKAGSGKSTGKGKPGGKATAETKPADTAQGASATDSATSPATSPETKTA